MDKAKLTIGRLASAAGVNVETVRYYQRVGLIREPARPLQGFRHYSVETVARIRFIKAAQRLGFTLPEIAQLLQLGDGQCDDVLQLAMEKRAHIEARLADLEAMRETLEQLIRACDSKEGHRACPIVQALTNKRPTDV